MDFGTNMTPALSLPTVDRKERLYKYIGKLNIKTRPVSPEAQKKWFGMPPTPLETPRSWRNGGTVSF